MIAFIIIFIDFTGKASNFNQQSYRLILISREREWERESVRAFDDENHRFGKYFKLNFYKTRHIREKNETRTGNYYFACFLCIKDMIYYVDKKRKKKNPPFSSYFKRFIISPFPPHRIFDVKIIKEFKFLVPTGNNILDSAWKLGKKRGNHLQRINCNKIK